MDGCKAIHLSSIYHSGSGHIVRLMSTTPLIVALCFFLPKERENIYVDTDNHRHLTTYPQILLISSSIHIDNTYL